VYLCFQHGVDLFFLKGDGMDFNNFIVNPVTLALIILGVVEFIKKFGVTGNKLMLISMFVGITLAVIYKVRELYVPAQPYIDVAFFGIAAGLGASGLYSFVNDRFPVQTKATASTSTNERWGGNSLQQPQDPTVSISISSVSNEENK
jgi:xanthosine utilization system XapX-like protein